MTLGEQLKAKVENKQDPFLEKQLELYRLCDETKTSKSGMAYLVNYYINSLGWTEEQAVEYAISLFHNGTIQQIKLFNKDGEEL